jgi:hypothetical protein
VVAAESLPEVHDRVASLADYSHISRAWLVILTGNCSNREHSLLLSQVIVRIASIGGYSHT